MLHAYAIDPPSKLSVASAAAIQDLACLRLVQAGEYAAAVKLDRQLPPGGAAAKDRRQMMDELMASMPRAERQLLQIELEKLTAPARPNLNAALAKRGSMTSSADLSMSWESVRPPPASTLTKPVSSVGPSSAQQVNGTGTPSASLPTISQRSGGPRFGAPLGATPHTETFAPLSFTTSTSTSAPTFAPSISAARPRLSAGGSGSAVRPGSLFETAGSANQTPNAFYTPPTSVSAGARRTFGQDTPTAQPRRPSTSPRRPAPAPAPADGDVTMQTDEDAIAAELADITQPDTPPAPIPAPAPAHAQEPSSSPTAEFSASVFGRGASAERQRSVSARRLRKEKSDSPFIPGGFGPIATTDDEAERFSMPPPPLPPATRKPRPSTSASASARSRGSPEQSAQRKTRTRAGSTARKERGKDVDLARSIPGGFVTEEDEEEDAVPPLPPPTPATAKKGRKPRVSKAAAAGEKDEMTAEELRPRRSTRLSTAPSVGESSPEPSPTKPSAKTRSTRKSTAAGAGAPATRSSRKKR